MGRTIRKIRTSRVTKGRNGYKQAVKAPRSKKVMLQIQESAQDDASKKKYGSQNGQGKEKKKLFLVVTERNWVEITEESGISITGRDHIGRNSKSEDFCWIKIQIAGTNHLVIVIQQGEQQYQSVERVGEKFQWLGVRTTTKPGIPNPALAKKKIA